MLYLLRHLLSILVLPFTVTIVVPCLLLRGDLSRELAQREPLIRLLALLAGAASLLIGLILFTATVTDFARRGRGTLAPWDPPPVPGRPRYLSLCSQPND